MLRFILADLRRLWAGSLVMVLLISLAVALGVGITLQERALRLGSARASEKFDLVIGARGSETQLVLSTVFLQAAPLPLVPGTVLTELQDDPSVAWAAPVGFGDFYRGNPLIGTTRELISKTASHFSQGRMFVTEGEAVAGAKVDLSVGDRVTPTHGELARGGHSHDEVSYTITGRLAPTGTPWDRAILLPIQAVWHVHGLHESHDHDHEQNRGHEDEAKADHEHSHEHSDEHGHDHADGGFDADAPVIEDWHHTNIPGVPAILVKPKTVADAYRLRQKYRADERSVGVFPAEVLTGLYGMMGDARQVLNIVAAGAQALVGAALLMVIVVHIGQRRRQIGALRALGAHGRAIFALVWSELFALVFIGTALGTLMGYLAAVTLSRAISLRQGFDLPVALTSGDVAGLALLLVAAAVMALLPAWIAYRQSPVASLRG